MKRVMVNFPDDIGAQVEARAKAEKRSMSAHLLRLAEADLRSAGVLVTLAAEEAEMLGAVKDVSAKHGDNTRRALAKISRMSPRKLAEVLELPTPDPKRAA